MSQVSLATKCVCGISFLKCCLSVACQTTARPVKPVFRQPLATRMIHSSVALVLRMRLLNAFIHALLERAPNAPMALVVIRTQRAIRLKQEEIPDIHLYLPCLQIRITAGLLLMMLRCTAENPVRQVYQRNAQGNKHVLLERLVLTKNLSSVGELGMMQPPLVPLHVGKEQVQLVPMASSALALLHVLKQTHFIAVRASKMLHQDVPQHARLV